MSEQQPPIDTEYNASPDGGIILMWIFILALVAWILSKIFPKEEQKKYKAQLAKEYGVSTKVLMYWLKIFTNDAFKAQYVQTKKQLLPIDTIAFYIGKPEDRPFDKQERPIKTKAELAKVLFISNSTLTERVKSIKLPESYLRMNYEQYSQLRTLPPLQVKLLLEQMKINGFDVSRVKTMSALTHE